MPSSRPRSTTTETEKTQSLAASLVASAPPHESAFRRHRTAIITTASLALLGTAAIATFFFAPAVVGVMSGYALSVGNALSTFSLTNFASTLVGQMTIAAVATSALIAGLVASFKNRGKGVPPPSDRDLSALGGGDDEDGKVEIPTDGIAATHTLATTASRGTAVLTETPPPIHTPSTLYPPRSAYRQQDSHDESADLGTSSSFSHN